MKGSQNSNAVLLLLRKYPITIQNKSSLKNKLILRYNEGSTGIHTRL